MASRTLGINTPGIRVLLHYGVIVALAYLFLPWHVDVVVKFLLVSTLSLAITLALGEAHHACRESHLLVPKEGVPIASGGHIPDRLSPGFSCDFLRYHWSRWCLLCALNCTKHAPPECCQ
jgi:hypothetical protein